MDKIIRLYNFAPIETEDTMNSLAIEMINYITENYRQNISLETAAKHFGYSKPTSRLKFNEKAKLIKSPVFDKMNVYDKICRKEDF